MTQLRSVEVEQMKDLIADFMCEHKISMMFACQDNYTGEISIKGAWKWEMEIKQSSPKVVRLVKPQKRG